MVNREHYSRNIQCPSCGKEGKLHLSEDNDSLSRKLHRRIEQVEDSFNAAMSGDTEIILICNICGHVYVE